LGSYGSRGYEPPGSGSQYVVCDASVSDEAYGDTLVSPAVYSADYDSLKLTYAYVFSKGGLGTPDQASVMVRYHDGVSWGGWVSLRRYWETDSGVDTLSLDAGYDSIQVAFSYDSPEGGYWFALDDVRLLGSTSFTYDVEATSIDEPPALLHMGQLAYITATATNLGANDVHVVLNAYALFGGDTVFRGTHDFIAEASHSYTLNFGWFVPESLGTYRVIFTVAADTDEYAGNDTLTSSFTVKPSPQISFEIPHAPSPLLDGNISAGEWDAAYRLDASNYLGKYTQATDTGVVIVLLQHDGANLNLAVITGDTTYDSTDALFIFLDDDGDRVWESGEGLNVIRTHSYILWATMDSSRAYLFPRKDLMARVARRGGIYEISLPMGTLPEDEPARLRTFPGGDFGMYILYRDGRTGRFVGWWPQTMDGPPDSLKRSDAILTLERPEGWHDMGLGGIVGGDGCLVARVCSLGVFIYDNSSLRMEVETLRVLLRRGSDPVAGAMWILNDIYESSDTVWFRWVPSDTGYYEILAYMSGDDAPGNDTLHHYVGAYAPVRPPYRQDFEGRWPPVGWRVVGRGWVKGNYLAVENVAPTFGSSGTGFAEFLSYVLPSGDSSALEMPPIHLEGEAHLVLRVWNAPSWSGRGNYDRLDLYYRSVGSPVWYPLGSIFGDMPTWLPHTFNLPNVEDDIIVRVVARSDLGDTDISLDDVEVLSGLSVDEGRSERASCILEGGSIRFKGSLKVFGVDGRLILERMSDSETSVRLPSGRRVLFVICNSVVMRAIPPLK